MLKSKFWRDAAARLPAHVRTRYMRELERAERWELALDGAIETLARAKAGFAARFQGAH